MLAEASYHAVIRDELVFVVRVGRLDIAIPDDLLALFLTEHELGRREEAAERDLAELLFFEELCDVHAHAKFTMTFLHFREEIASATCDHLPNRRSGDAVSRGKFSLDFEVDGLFFRFSLEFV